VEKYTVPRQYYEGSRTNQGPRVSMRYADGALRKTVEHTEFFATVQDSIGFSTSTWAVNPANYVLFPFLSNESVNWERYKFTKLKFHYHTQSSTARVGSAIMGFDIDATDEAPPDFTTLASYLGSIDFPTWASKRVTMEVNCGLMNDQLKSFYVGTFASLHDILLRDCGTFIFGTEGAPSALSVGKLFVEYSCEFMSPQLPASGLKAPGDAAAATMGESPSGAFNASLTSVVNDGDVAIDLRGSTKAGGPDLPNSETFVWSKLGEWVTLSIEVLLGGGSGNTLTYGTVNGYDIEVEEFHKDDDAGHSYLDLVYRLVRTVGPAAIDYSTYTYGVSGYIPILVALAGSAAAFVGTKSYVARMTPRVSLLPVLTPRTLIRGDIEMKDHVLGGTLHSNGNCKNVVPYAMGRIIRPSSDDCGKSESKIDVARIRPRSRSATATSSSSWEKL